MTVGRFFFVALRRRVLEVSCYCVVGATTEVFTMVVAGCCCVEG